MRFTVSEKQELKRKEEAAAKTSGNQKKSHPSLF
jgi:hypothetical protein